MMLPTALFEGFSGSPPNFYEKFTFAMTNTTAYMGRGFCFFFLKIKKT